MKIICALMRENLSLGFLNLEKKITIKHCFGLKGYIMKIICALLRENLSLGFLNLENNNNKTLFWS